jgi:GNAT superfamily N-acetyltransferase
MEIGTLQTADVERVLELLDGWELPDGWRGREFFRRPMELDPSYTHENFWVAREGDTLLSCVQIFPRQIRLLGHAVPTGGIGSVFTRSDRRGEGLAGALLAAAADAMRRRGMELSLLFTGRVSFYEQHGFSSWKTERALARRTGRAPGAARSRAIGGGAAAPEAAGALELSPFEVQRDLAAVQALYEAYSRDRHGTVVRDDGLWRASLQLAGNPDETFTVARRGGEVVAYLRTTRLYEREVATEVARAADAPGALAALVDAALAEAGGGPAEGDPASADSRPADLLLPAFDDLEFTLALEQAGITSKPLEDPTNMLRCLDGPALSRRLGAPMRAGETDVEFLTRALPKDQFAFWPADRF